MFGTAVILIGIALVFASHSMLLDKDFKCIDSYCFLIHDSYDVVQDVKCPVGSYVLELSNDVTFISSFKYFVDELDAKHEYLFLNMHIEPVVFDENENKTEIVDFDSHLSYKNGSFVYQCPFQKFYYICQFKFKKEEDCTAALSSYIGQICYIAFEITRNWFQARNHCNTLNGDLASFNSTNVLLGEVSKSNHSYWLADKKVVWVGSHSPVELDFTLWNVTESICSSNPYHLVVIDQKFNISILNETDQSLVTVVCVINKPEKKSSSLYEQNDSDQTTLGDNVTEFYYDIIQPEIYISKDEPEMRLSSFCVQNDSNKNSPDGRPTAFFYDIEQAKNELTEEYIGRSLLIFIFILLLFLVCFLEFTIEIQKFFSILFNITFLNIYFLIYADEL